MKNYNYIIRVSSHDQEYRNVVLKQGSMIAYEKFPGYNRNEVWLLADCRFTDNDTCRWSTWVLLSSTGMVKSTYRRDFTIKDPYKERDYDIAFPCKNFIQLA